MKGVFIGVGWHAPFYKSGEEVTNYFQAITKHLVLLDKHSIYYYTMVLSLHVASGLNFGQQMFAVVPG